MTKACIFDVEFGVSDVEFKIAVDGLQIVTTSDLPPYEGSYMVDALVKAPVILPTKGNNKIDDITENKIQQQEIKNTDSDKTKTQNKKQ